MKSYVTELIGTFFLVLVIALTGDPVAIGAILVAMIYAGGYISGAHYNPAVTLAMFMRGKLNIRESAFYMLAQIVGAILAAIAVLVITGTRFVPEPGPTATLGAFILIEALFGFALATVALHTTTSHKVVHNQYYGIAIGLVITAGVYAGAKFSGAAYNPAVALGPVLIDLKNIAEHGPNLIWYILAPLVGAALASIVYRITADAEA